MRHVLRWTLIGMLMYGAYSKSHAQSVQLKQIWRKHISGPGGSEIINDMAVHPDGSVLVTGRYDANQNVDVNAPGTLNLPSSSASDMFLIQYQSGGTPDWATKYHYNNNDVAFAVTYGNNKQPILGGGVNTGFSGFQFSNFYIASANSGTGAIAGFISGFNSTTPNQLTALAKDSLGVVYGGALFGGTVDVNASRTGAVNLTSAGGADIAIMKYTANLNVSWAKRIGGTGSEYLNRMVIAQQAIYAVGTFTGTVDFDPGPSVFNLSSGTSVTNGFIVKLDLDGNFLNAWALTSTSANNVRDITVNPAGELFICGQFDGSVDIDPGAGTNTITSAGSSDGFIAKLSATGDLQWVRTTGGAQAESFNRIVMNKLGDVYATGTFQSASINVGSITLSNTGTTSTTDAFITAYDASGNTMLGNKIGGTGDDFITALGFDSTLNLYVSGYFNSSNFQTETAPGYSQILAAANAFDAFVIKFNTVCPLVLGAAPFDQVACAGSNVTIPFSVFGSNLNFTWRYNNNPITNSSKYTGVDNDTLIINQLQLTDTGRYALEVSRASCNTLSLPSVGAYVNPGRLTVLPSFHYKMDGNLQNSAGRNAATLFNAAYTTNRFGTAQRALFAQFSNTVVDIPDTTGNNLTIAFWFLSSNNAFTQHLVVSNSTTAVLSNVNGRLGSTSTPFTDMNAPIALNTWYHVVLVKEGTRCKLYLNGVKTYDNAGFFSPTALNISHLFGHPTQSQSLIGAADDARIYMTSFTDADAVLLYNMPEAQQIIRTSVACTNGSVNPRMKLGNAHQYTYQWAQSGNAISNGSNIAGATSDSLILSNGNPTQNGWYVLNATIGCYQYAVDSVLVSFGDGSLTNGLLSYYLFNGNLNDENGVRNMTGTAGYVQQNRFGSTGQSINGPNFQNAFNFTAVSTDTITIGAWFFVSGMDQTRNIFSAGNSAAAHLSISSNNVLGFTMPNNTFVPSTFTVASQRWYHFTVVKAGTNQKIYVDGVPVMEVNNAFLNSIVNNAFGRINNGSTAGTPSLGFYDDLFIYNRELSLVEIGALRDWFAITRQPAAAAACNGSLNTVRFNFQGENRDTTKYLMSWTYNGSPLVNNTKVNGANGDTLTISEVTINDSGAYAVRVAAPATSCIFWPSRSAQLQVQGNNEMRDSLRSFQRFNGTSADVSGNNRVWTSNSVTYTTDRFGLSNAAAVFNGTDSRISSQSSIASTQQVFTVMLWFKANQGTGGLISNANVLPPNAPNSYNSFLYIGTDNKLKGKAYNGNLTAMSSTVDVNDDVWHHAALVVYGNNNQQALYLDGVLVATQATTTTSLATNYVIGANWGGGWSNTTTGWNYFQGSIDDVRMYHRSFSSEEIARIAQPIGFTSGKRQAVYCTNATAIIPANASGSGLTYKWFKGSTELVNSTNIRGVDSNVLVINQTTSVDTGVYFCKISKDCYTVASDTIQIGLSSAITIAANPVSGNYCPSNTIRLTVVARGASLQYQWKRNGSNILNTTNISGATSDTLTIINSDTSNAGTYTVTLTDGCQNTLTSANANVNISIAQVPGRAAEKAYYPLNGNGTSFPSIYNGIGTNITAAVGRFGSTGSGTNFVSMSGSRIQLPIGIIPSGNPNFTVSVWFKTSTANTTMGLVGATSGLPPSAPTTGWSPMLYITNTGRLSGKFYDVNATPPVSGQVVTDGLWHQAVLTGNGTSQSLYLDGVLVGTSNAVYSTSTTQNVLIGASYASGWAGHTNGWQYFNGTLDEVRISSAHMTADDIAKQFARPDITTQPSPITTICPGVSGSSLTVRAEGNNLLYQWFKNGLPLQNAQQASFTINNMSVADTGSYVCRISSGCVFVWSDTAAVRLNSKPVVTAQPQQQTTCEGGSANLSIAAIGSGISYQWKKGNTVLANGNTYNGVSTAQLNITNITAADTGLYYCVLSNICGTDSSMQARVSLNTGLQILREPLSATVCEGSRFELSVSATDPAASYFWQKNGLPLSTVSNDTLLFGAITLGDTGLYRVVINSVCGTDTSIEARITVNAQTRIINQPITQSVCPSKKLELSIEAAGSGVTYQWQVNGINITSATSNRYIVANPTIADTGFYRVIVSGSCGSQIQSSTVRVDVSSPVTITQQSIPTLSFCPSATNYTNLIITATGSVLGYQWYRNGVAITNSGTNITGANTRNLQFWTSSLGQGTYTCKVFGACDTVTSTGTVLSLVQFPNVTQQPQNKQVCSGTTVWSAVKATNAISYQWFINGTAVQDFPGKVSGANSDSIVVTGLTAADIGGTSAVISVEVTGSCQGMLVRSSEALITIVESASIKDQSPATNTVCAGSTLFSFCTGEFRCNLPMETQWQHHYIGNKRYPCINQSHSD